MIYYIVCPYFKTGGPEAMHQLCHELNEMSKEAYIYYVNPPKDSTPLYTKEYPNVQVTTTLEDDPKHLLILPEIYTKELFQSVTPIQHIRVAIWWLSLYNAMTFNSLATNIQDPNVIHLFQSHFVKEFVLKKIDSTIKWFDLQDYTRFSFVDAYQQKNISLERKDMIAYNPTKDFLFPKYIQDWNLKTLPVVDLSPTMMLYKLHECKIYVDLGGHPGKDRIPREAAMAGCVVITNQLGAALNDVDIPIEEKVDGPEALKELIDKILVNYSYYYEKQKPYRDWILDEKTRFVQQIREMIHILETN